MRHRFQASFRRVLLFTCWRSGFRPSSFQPYHAGLATRRPIRLGTAVTFLACYCPLPVSLPGKPSDPGTSLRVPPGYAGDITERLAAQTRQMRMIHVAVPLVRLAWVSTAPREV